MIKNWWNNLSDDQKNDWLLIMFFTPGALCIIVPTVLLYLGWI